MFKVEEALESKKIKSLRDAIINFIVGGIIRRLQDKKTNKFEKKYSFIIHTEQRKESHQWQEIIISKIIEMFTEVCEKNETIFKDLVLKSYSNLNTSISLIKGEIPTLKEVAYEVQDALKNGYVMITKVNSEKDVKELLDETGQLKLRTPLNLFIGGQILDRGITIGNLIGFYYGRRPNIFQQDTVLQHSRMFGYRPIEDLAVTRFYTTHDIYSVMKTIHEFDTALREAFEKGGHNSGVVFIQKDLKNRIIPCSPNKIILSNITTLKPYKRLLPVGFKTDFKYKIEKYIKELDNLIFSFLPNNNLEGTFLVDINKLNIIIKLISKTLVFEEGYNWDLKAFISSLEYLSRNTQNEEQKGKAWVIVRTGRNIKRVDSLGNYEDSPDTPRDETSLAKQVGQDVPVIILLRQNGLKENGWEGTEFWWPILVVPKNTKTVIFASETIE